MANWLPIPFRVVILGGGLSGLSAAHTILKHASVPTEVTIIEAQRRLGGWLESTRYEDGTVFEHGPRSARSYGNVALDALSVLSEIGVDDNFIGIPKTTDAAQRRYIYFNGQIVEMPRGIGLARKWGPLPKPLLSYLVREPFVKKSEMEDESMHAFFQRRFNSEEIADYLCDPLCRGIFGGDSKKLSVRSCFPILFDYEQQHGSILKGALFTKPKGVIPLSSLSNKAKDEKWMAWSLKGGIQTLPDLWTEYLTTKGLACLLNTHCTQIRTTDDGTTRKVQVFTNGGVVEADRVISTVSAPVLSSLIQEEDSKLSTLLDSIEYASMAVTTLEYKNCSHPHTGFGYLVPSREPLDILGVTFDSQLFPQNVRPDSSVVTVMAGGARFRELFGRPDGFNDADKATELSVKSVRDTLKFQSDPVRHVTKMNKDCIPQYRVGHHKLADKIENYVKNQNMPLTILGNLWGGVGVNDVIVNSRNDTLKWLASNHMY